MRSSGEGLLGEKTKAEFMAKMKFLRTSVFKDDFKVDYRLAMLATFRAV